MYVKRLWVCLAQRSAVHVQAVFGGVAIINRKQDLNLWGQGSLVNSLSLRIRRPGFWFQLILYLPCDLRPLLGCKNITIILHLVHLAFVSKAHAMSQGAVAEFCSVKGRPGAWPRLLPWAASVGGQVPVLPRRHFRHRMAELFPLLYSTRPESRWMCLHIHILAGLCRSDCRPLFFFYFPLISESSVVSLYFMLKKEHIYTIKLSKNLLYIFKHKCVRWTWDHIELFVVVNKACFFQRGVGCWFEVNYQFV